MEHIKSTIEHYVQAFEKDPWSDGSMTAIVVLPWASRETLVLVFTDYGTKKDACRQTLHEIAKEASASAVIAILNVWWSVSPTKNPRQRPSSDPNRKSALVIYTIYPDGSCSLDFRPYSEHEGKLIWEDANIGQPTAPHQQYILRPWGKKGPVA